MRPPVKCSECAWPQDVPNEHRSLSPSWGGPGGPGLGALSLQPLHPWPRGFSVFVCLSSVFYKDT